MTSTQPKLLLRRYDRYSGHPIGLTIAAAAFALTLPVGSSVAHEFKAENVTVVHPWTPPTAAANSPIFMTIVNDGGGTTVIAADVTGASRSGLMATIGQPTKSLDIEANATLSLEPGGRHVMAIGLGDTLSTDQSIPVILTFGDGSTIALQATVEPAASHQ